MQSGTARTIRRRIRRVATRIDAQRREAYYARYGGEHHVLHDARANAWACTG